MTTERARKPDLQSDAWADSLNIASNMSTVKKSYWRLLMVYDKFCIQKGASGSGNNETFTFSVLLLKVVEKKVIGNHTFFRVEGLLIFKNFSTYSL